jgi:4-hydroxy-2-oxoheptanedioate aldolase
MDSNPLRTLWKSGKAAVNGWVTIPSGFAAEVMARQGWDSVTIYTQHGLIDFGAAVECLRAVSTTAAVPMVRAWWNDPSGIMRLLDAGAFGVICPMVNSRADAERLVGACRYAPQGYRSFGPARTQLVAGPDYVARAHELVVVLAMIETVEALENVEEIAATPGLDGLYIGPSDLSLALGLPPHQDSRDPAMLAAQDRVLAAAERNGIVAGIHNASGSYAREMAARGFRLVTVANDSRLLGTAAKKALDDARGLDVARTPGTTGGY